MNIINNYHFYAIITIVFWALAFIVTKFCLTHFSAFQLGAIRYIIASLVLFIFVIIRKLKIPLLSDFPLFILSGAAGFFLYMIAFNIGQGITTASTASVIIATTPIITALLARIIYKEKLKIFQWSAIVIEFSGIIILTLLNGVFSINNGVFWLLSAAVCVSIYSLIQRKLTTKYTALQASSYSIFFGTLMLCIFLPSSIPEIKTAPNIQILYLIILGVFSSAIAYVTWTKAFSLAEKISDVSNYCFLTPFLATLFGFILAGEVPDRATILGGSLILFGMLIFNFWDKFKCFFKK